MITLRETADRAVSFRHLTVGERSRVETDILSKKQTQWSEEETEIWIEYMLDGPFYGGVKRLMRGTRIKFQGEEYQISPVAPEVAEEFVMEWITRFIEARRYDPTHTTGSCQVLFLKYFHVGCALIALTQQRRMSIPKPKDFEPEDDLENTIRRIPVNLVSIDGEREGGHSNLKTLESHRNMKKDPSFVDELEKAEIYELLEKITGPITNKRDRSGVKAVILSVVWGWSMKQIAMEFDTTEGYAKQMCLHGRSVLRPILAEIFEKGAKR